MLKEAVERNMRFADDVAAADKWPAMYGAAMGMLQHLHTRMTYPLPGEEGRVFWRDELEKVIDEMQFVAKRPRLIIDLLTDEMIDGYERKSERT